MQSNSSFSTTPWDSRLNRYLGFAFIGTLPLILIGVPFAAKPVIQGGGAIMALCAFASLFLLRPRLNLPVLPLFIMGGALLLVGLGTFWSVAPGASIAALPRLSFMFLSASAFMIYARTMPVPDIRVFYGLTVSLLAGIVAVICIQTSDYALIEWWRGVNEVQGYVENKGVGVLTLLAPAILFPVFLVGRGIWRILVAGIFSLLFAMVATGEGQSSLLALIFMVLSLAMPLQSRLFYCCLSAVIIVGVLGAPWIVTYLFGLADLMTHSSLLQTASAPQRLEVWNAIAQEILTRPVFGHGYEATRYIPHFNSDEIYQPGTTFSHPHNMALQFWMEFGVVGAVLGTTALLAILRQIFQTPNPTVRRMYFTSYSAIMVVSLIGWGMWQGWWMVLVFLVITTNILAGRVIAAASDAQAVESRNSPAIS